MKDFNVSHFEEHGRSPIAPTHDVPGGWLASLLRAITTTPADDAPRFEGIPAYEVESRWSRHLSLHTVERLSKADVVLCGRFDPAARGHFADIGSYARSFRCFATEVETTAFLKRTLSARQMVVFQVRDLIGALPRLEEFRSRFPQAAVVLVCPELVRNDFSGERRVICDASLRAAETRSSVAMAVTVALQNHDEYVARAIY